MQRPTDNLTYAIVIYVADTENVIRVVPIDDLEFITARERLVRIDLLMEQHAILNETNWSEGTTTPVLKKRRSRFPDPPTAGGKLVAVLSMWDLKESS